MRWLAGILLLLAACNSHQPAGNNGREPGKDTAAMQRDTGAAIDTVTPVGIDTVFHRFQQGIRNALPAQVAAEVYFPLPGSEACAGENNNLPQPVTYQNFTAAFGCLFNNDARDLIKAATIRENLHRVDATDIRWEADFAAIKSLINTHYPAYELYFEYAHTNAAGREKGRYYGYLFAVIGHAYKLCYVYRNA
ncbi:hypothetical protein [Deminuibacter soli]|uniref:Uncharacterized protein n=1 Tax=Deminuibacter soli TaxID=2291815 RepID=A0A3E1NC43_9BACT|nr:hypothetical protein [Deminuibacter soli]RFM25589.1 hypothetical protein DXN05_24230 [Deminuibacter soli]